VISYIIRTEDSIDSESFKNMMFHGHMYEIKLKNFDPILLTPKEMETAIKDFLVKRDGKVMM
jgi:hypothetical protein